MAGGETRFRSFLREVPLFADLDDELLDEVADRCETVSVPAGEWGFRQGETGDKLYLVRSGRLEVIVEDPPPARVVGIVPRGAALGELALLTGESRVASVRALRDTELVTISRSGFDQLLDDQRFAVALTAFLARQMRAGARFRPPKQRRAVLTVVPVGRVEVAPLVEGLVATLGRTRRVARFDRPEDTDRDERGQRLDRLEAEHDHVVLVAPDVDSPDGLGEWGSFCLRQADRVIAVAASDRRAPSSGLDPALQGCDLAVVGSRPRAADLAGWLDTVGVRATHWIPTDQGFDGAVARMTRRISGQSVGLVCSGGGARGFAHIGAIAALQAAGVTVDRFAGVSSGSIVSALFATGRDVEAVTRACRKGMVELKPYSDYTFPRFSLLRGHRGHDILRRYFGSTQVEELPLSWYAISADLISAETVVHRRGSVADAVMASVSLPGVLPPQASDGRLLVDGGVVNNLPTDVMGATDEGPILAIDVMSRWGERWRERQDPERWRRSLWARLGWSEPVPTIVETITASSVLASRQQVEDQQALAALTIVPDLASFALWDWDQIDQLVEAGRVAAEAALDRQPGLVARLAAWPLDASPAG